MRISMMLATATYMVWGSGSAVAQVASLQAPTPATPQDEAASRPDTGDIIVTAQRRDESLSRTPVAVTVISADTLDRAQITRADDLREAAPGLSVRSGLSSEQLNFSLRGNTQDPFSNVRPGVLPYINDVQIGSQGGSSAFYDLQSIQVLKGPQGTLFGRSATGGALLFTTQKPTDTLGGYVSGLYGNYNQAKIEGAINVPLSSDELLLRVAGFYSRRDGFQYNLYDNQVEGRQRKFGVRPSLTAKFGPDIENDLVVDYYKSDSQNTVGVISGLLPYTGAGTPYVPATFLYAGTATPTATITGQCTLQGFAGLGACPPVNPAVAGYYNAYFATHPANGLTAQLAQQQARGPYVINDDGGNFANTRSTILTDTTNIDIGGGARVKNILGYANVHSATAFDADATPYAISETGPKGSQSALAQIYTSFTDELQIGGKTLSSNLDYVIGGYFSDERTTTDFTTQFFDIVFGGQAQHNVYRISNRTYAAYGQGTYRFGDSGFGVTAGLRYTDEDVRKELLNGDSFRAALGATPPPGYSYDKHRRFDNLSWTLGLQYQVTSQLLLYVANHRAFRSGGFNGQSSPFNGDGTVGGDLYRPERVTDYEAGAKFNGVVGNMPFRLSGDFYYNDIIDSQRAAFAFIAGNIATVTVNVPKARTYGVELEGQIRPVKPLTIGGTFNYTNATFTSGNVSVAGIPQIFDQVPDTPRYSASGFVDLKIPLGGSLSTLVHGDVYHQSSTTTSPRSANFAGTTVPDYTLGTFRLGVEDDKAGWSLTANLKNAFGKVYYVGGLQAGEIYQINTLVPGDPRMVTVEARFKF